VSPPGRLVADQVYGKLPPVALKVAETLEPKPISASVPETGDRERRRWRSGRWRGGLATVKLCVTGVAAA